VAYPDKQCCIAARSKRATPPQMVRNAMMGHPRRRDELYLVVPTAGFEPATKGL
jgi:hypothetical protein